MNKWKIAIAAIGVALFVAWYAFRPERLFINERVHEALPFANASSTQAIEFPPFGPRYSRGRFVSLEVIFKVRLM